MYFRIMHLVGRESSRVATASNSSLCAVSVCCHILLCASWRKNKVACGKSLYLFTDFTKTPQQQGTKFDGDVAIISYIGPNSLYSTLEPVSNWPRRSRRPNTRKNFASSDPTKHICFLLH